MICEIRVMTNDSKTLMYYVCRSFTNWLELYDFAATYGAALTATEAKAAITDDKDILLFVTQAEADGVREVLQYSADHDSADLHHFALDGYDNISGQWQPSAQSNYTYNYWNVLEDASSDAALPEGAKDSSNTNCEHSWVEYYGLVESFDYCKKCDTKRYTK